MPILEVEVQKAMISQTAEYALRAIVYLADQEAMPRTTMQIARATQVPAGYLAKVMQNLSRSRLVKSQRGINGGFTLNSEPSELSLLTVIEAVDPIRRFKECPLGIHGVEDCPLHKKLDDVTQMVETVFRDTSIADILKAPAAEKPPCCFPAEREGVS